MTPITDEQIVRAALAGLTGEQPPEPPGRLRAVRRRAVRNRRRQLAGAAVSALAVAGIAVGLVRLPPVLHHEPQARAVPSWALPWPDYRNGSVPQSVLNNAVLAWGDPALHIQGSVAPSSPRQIARVVASYHVVWYVGQTVAHGQDVAVIFEATSPDTGPVLVVGFASASEVMKGQPAWSGPVSPWVLNSTAAPNSPRTFGPDISEYVPELRGPGSGADNWILVLTAPGGELTSWTAVSGNGRTEITGVTSQGVYVHDVGPVTAAVMLTFGRWREFVPVGIGGASAAPSLAPPALRPPPGSFRAVVSYTGQGSALNEYLSVTRSGGPYAVVGSCYNTTPMAHNPTASRASGHRLLRVTVNGHSIGAITCDDQQHELAVPRSALRPRGVMVGWTGSAMTSWRVAFGRA
jgi:hypothetical protein